MLPASRALISVSDKTGLLDLGRGLTRLGIEIVSTGGTLEFLAGHGVPVTAVSAVTGFPEILDGRVKTLHPHVHGGILARRQDPAHAGELAAHGIGWIDLVVVNLYPFRQTIAAGATLAQGVEMIDVGGPAMVRAAAKNFAGVAVAVDPLDYPRMLAALEEGGGVVSEALRRELARKAFRHTASYDGAIADWLEEQEEGGRSAAGDPGPASFPVHLDIGLKRTLELRYGENPHQVGAVYADRRGAGVLGGFRQLGGKELSWNNLLDADAARKIAGLFTEPTVVIVKHNNPCGVGRGADLTEAYERALATDPVSAFGSIVALNRPADGRLAEAIAGLFVEVLLAPGYDAAARERFAEKKNLRLLECPLYQPGNREIELRAVAGGFLAQPPDAYRDDEAAWTSPTRRAPTAEERRALEFAWRVARYVKSNAIVVANGDQTVGVGAGQMSRVDSCRLALQKAVLPVAGTVAASDAFFPFRDGLDVLAEAGVRAVIQPGGSKRDGEVVAAADERDIAMVVTGTRHFRH
ncbi:MAG: bifunctional phosphoribosylaminoimidazolecarboxamide formyltransferase/IMP cyclohydrolase [Acidobacteriota bacterium]|nr:bifunctional phosphoribosylaminoimidazolecarboxamide formyltransferase/IMP cyclohydrolase [Acidobacteriota bacterium]